MDCVVLFFRDNKLAAGERQRDRWSTQLFLKTFWELSYRILWASSLSSRKLLDAVSNFYQQKIKSSVHNQIRIQVCLISVRHNITHYVQNEPGRLVFQKCVRNSQLQWGSIKKQGIHKGKNTVTKTTATGVPANRLHYNKPQNIMEKSEASMLKILFIFIRDRKSWTHFKPWGNFQSKRNSAARLLYWSSFGLYCILRGPQNN